MPVNSIQPPLARTKTIATVGPACDQTPILKELIANGANIFRLNMAHGSRQEHDRIIEHIRAASDEADHTVGVLVDLAGPKIRLGELYEDPTICESGDEFLFVRGDTTNSRNELLSNYATLVDELTVGDCVMLADGVVSMRVITVDEDRVRCRVNDGGMLRSRQGINLPGVKLSVPTMSHEDRNNAIWAATVGADFVSLSFVRSPEEILELKELLIAQRSSALVIAKIEKSEALQRLDEIVAVADGVMVARGDLGVETDVAEMAVVQKRIISTCQSHLKPVIVATQMLDSMQHSLRPTRAEATDVANAILDGADACMLSGETAIGNFPRETVTMMNRIMLATERLLVDRPAQEVATVALSGIQPISSATVFGAAQIAEKIQAKLVVVATRSGATARVKSKQRDFIATIGVSQNAEALQRMTLFWGITPLAHAPVDDPVQLHEFITAWGRRHELLEVGDRIVYVTGTDVVQGTHNRVDLKEVR